MSEAAARNNATWCDAVCRAHGRPGVFADALWLNPRGTPRYYPDAVTLRPDADIAPLLARPALSVKDSFACLDLAPYGFTVLFEATWIAGLAGDATGWVRIADPAALAAWEQAWAGAETGPRVFLPPQLDDPDIAFLAWMRDGAIMGGGILNRGAGVVGLSNSFSRGLEPGAVRRGLMGAAGRLFPGLGLVGYARGEALASALDCGFTAGGKLRVWVRPARSP